jgi:hypothetical protein
MAERISPYRRPFRVVFIGDKTECAKWLPWARNKLFLFRRTLGKVWRKTLTPADDVLAIITRVSDEIDSIVIRSETRLLIHGLLELYLPPKPILGEIDPTWDIEASGGGTYKVLKRFYPRKSKKESDTYGPWGESKVLAKNWTRDDSGGHPNSLLQKTPGKFSGTMRMVVQLLIGQGQPVQYEYGFYACHGIYMASDGKPWVIEISRDRGVMAWKMPIAKAYKEGETSGLTVAERELAEQFRFIPKHRDIEEQRESAVTLLPPQEVAAFYTKAPFFGSCGWAFNYSGNEAQNTCWDMPHDDNGYIRGYRYRITITENDGAPIQATLSLIEDGIIHGTRSSCFKVPVEDAGVSMVDFDLFYNKSPTFWSTDGPLYVFFKRDSSPVVVRMSPGSEGEAVNSWFNWNVPDVQSLDSFVNNDGNRGRDPAPVVSNGPDNEDWFDGDYEIVNINASHIGGAFTLTTGPVPGKNAIKDEGRIADGEATEYQGAAHSFNMSVVAPWFDRESVYVATKTRDAGTTKIYNRLGESHFIRGTTVAVLNYTITGLCGGDVGYVYSAEFATDPSIGEYDSTWALAQFSLLLPFLPSSTGEAACVSASTPFGQSGFIEENTVTSDPYDVSFNVTLITSDGSEDVYSESFSDQETVLASNVNDLFEFWTLTGSDHFMAVYRDAFLSPSGNNLLLAYTQPNESELYTLAAPYPGDEVVGSLMPRLFVGKP